MSELPPIKIVKVPVGQVTIGGIEEFGSYIPANSFNKDVLKRIIKESLFEYFGEKYENTLDLYKALKP